MGDDLFSISADQGVEEIPEDVRRQFELVTLEVIESGRRRYSAKAIMERIRWHREIEKGEREFRVNNNWTAKLARWFMRRHPDHEGFFECRGKRDGWR